jgi:uncharacterized repeat protein (TIGR01451 family)
MTLGSIRQMKETSMTSLFDRLFRYVELFGRTRTPRHRIRTRRFLLEQLEDRLTPSGDSFSAPIGTIAAGGNAVIQWDATIDTPLTKGIDRVFNQASVSGTGFATILTDDPSVSGQADPTATLVDRAPMVTGVFVRSSTWTLNFLTSLQGQGVGNSVYGYALPTGADQTKSLPWSNLNLISVRFSENVSVAVDDLSIYCVGSAAPSVVAFGYNPSTLTAIWALAAPLPASKIRIVLDGSASGVKAVSDGQQLDGEWTDGTSTFSSGNGVAGGNFSFRFNVLPGDVDQNGQLDDTDASRIANFIATGSGGPSYLLDVDGNNAVNGLDLRRVGKSDPASLPPTRNPGGGAGSGWVVPAVPVPPSPPGTVGSTVTATLVAQLVTDVDGDGQADPGDRVRYTLTVVNSGSTAVSGVRVDDNLDARMTLVPGSITPAPPPIVATFANGGPVAEGSTGSVSFTNVSGGSGGYTYSYDFNNDGTFEVVNSTQATAQVPAAYLPDGPATRVVHGRVRDNNGTFVDFTSSITINNVPPTVNAGGPYSARAGTAVAFVAKVTDASSVDQAAGFTYAWDFGDGTTSTLAAPTHAYATIGTYTVTVTARDKDGGSGTATGTVAVGDVIVTPADNIPNFGANPTITAGRSGNWSDPGMWSLGRLPAAGDVVSIGGNTVVTYDVVSDTAVKTVAIQSGSSLRFRTDINTRLTVVNLLVMAGGELQIGTAANPVAATVKAEVVFPDVALDLVNDPAQYGNGLIALGKVTIYGAAMNQTFVELAAEPVAGATTLVLSQPVTGWRVGDRLELPDTRMLYSEIAPDDPTLGTYVSQRELVTLASISSDGLTLTLSQPLVFDHLGARDGDGVLNFLPHVANLTRNVVLRSANARGVRGHTLFTARADVDIHYAQFSGLGRTTVDFLNNTTFDASGNVTHIGTNQVGRYSVNFQNLVGPASPQGDGYQFTFQGNSVFCPLDPMTFRWGIAMHNSSYGLIQDNVLYNWAGAGIAADTGSEIHNVVAHNLITRISGFTTLGIQRVDERNSTDFAYEGAGMWFRGFQNYVRDNVVSEARVGYIYSAYVEGGAVPVPVTQGADPSQPGQYQSIWFNQQPILEFARNVVYGGWTNEALSIWGLGNQNGNILNPNMPESVIKDFHVWHVYSMAYYNYETDHLTFDGLVVRGDWSLMLRGIYVGTGLFAGDYVSRNFRVTNSDMQGLKTGFDAGVTGATAQTIDNTYMRNYLDFTFNIQHATGGALIVKPRTTVLTNVRFARLNVPDKFDLPPQSYIDMTGLPAGDLVNYVASDTVYVYGFNGVAGDNFQVYYNQQAASYILPQSTFNPDGTIQNLGCPVAGLSNAQAWQRYGIAFAGSVAPADATTRTGIVGLVKGI